MPGLDDDQAQEWRRLDRAVEESGYTADALSGAERARYDFYSNLVDEAVQSGERGWMPPCPVHSRGGDGEGPDGWGHDLACRLCLGPDNKPVSVNRLGIAEKVRHQGAVRDLDAHHSKFADAADFFGSRKPRDPSEHKFIDVDLNT